MPSGNVSHKSAHTCNAIGNKSSNSAVSSSDLVLTSAPKESNLGRVRWLQEPKDKGPTMYSSQAPSTEASKMQPPSN